MIQIGSVINFSGREQPLFNSYTWIGSRIQILGLPHLKLGFLSRASSLLLVVKLAGLQAASDQSLDLREIEMRFKSWLQMDRWNNNLDGLHVKLDIIGTEFQVSSSITLQFWYLVCDKKQYVLTPGCFGVIRSVAILHLPGTFTGKGSAMGPPFLGSQCHMISGFADDWYI